MQRNYSLEAYLRKTLNPFQNVVLFLKSDGIFIFNAPDFKKALLFLEGSQDSSNCSGTSTEKTKVRTERGWNDIGRGKLEHSEENLSQCHFVHRKSHGLTRDRIRASVVRRQRVTLRTMEWPERNLSMLCWYVRLQTSFPTAQRTKPVPTAKTNRFILF